MDPRVLDKMLPYFTEMYGNPHSKSHIYGWEAEKAVENARESIAKLIGAEAKEIIFTSGATESNNLSLKGVAEFYKDKKKHIITTQTEHKCVLDTCRHLQQNGFEVTYLPVQKNGLVDLEILKSNIRKDTLIASIMYINNEIGVIQPLEKIGKILRENNVFFHTDAAQAVGKIPVDVNKLNLDLMSISGHKFYGPKGIGALYIRRKPRVRLLPIINGGGQERGLRSGTLPTPICVGMGAAADIAREDLDFDYKHVKKLSDRMYKKLTDNIEHIYLNGDEIDRYPGNLNISFSFVEGESLIMAIKEIAVSSGSACTSASLEPSYVLRALGVEEDLAHTSLRIGIGRFTTEKEVDFAADLITKSVERLRSMSPLWEMVQEGIDLKSIKWTQH
jgi:cysteine desulfurase